MPQRHRPAYPAEFRKRIVKLARAGRTPEDLAKEFEPSAQTFRNWVAQTERDRLDKARTRRERRLLSEDPEASGFRS